MKTALLRPTRPAAAADRPRRTPAPLQVTMMTARLVLVCSLVGVLLGAATPGWAQSLIDPNQPTAGAEPNDQSTLAADASLDPQVVYRYIPAVQQGRLGQRLAPMAGNDDTKSRSVYYRFNPALGRHVWSVLAKDGRWYFALGEGSTVRTELLDIRLTAEQRIEILEAFAPRLKQKLEEPDRARNINLYLRLDGDDAWRLQGDSLTPKVQSVFDLLTGHRWEWHGPDRHAVLHTTGDMWQVIDGRYAPISIDVGVLYDGCNRRPAGSILNVVRTPSPMPTAQP